MLQSWDKLTMKIYDKENFEWECKNANGYFVASCLGKIKNCHLPKYQAKDKKYCEVQDEPKTTRGESD